MSCGRMAPFRPINDDSIDCVRGQHLKDLPHRTKYGRVWTDAEESTHELQNKLVVSIFRDLDTHGRLQLLDDIEGVCCLGCGALRFAPAEDAPGCSCGRGRRKR